MTRGMLGRVALLGALATALWCVGGAAEAQYGNMRPRFGYANLQAGFMPDPHIMQGTMGGITPAQQFSPNCRGTVNPDPSHIIRTQSGFQNIRFVVNGQGDSTLMVQLPNGQVLCDDDGGEGLNPLIQTASPPGEIRVWVGVYSDSNQNRPYTIGITELNHITASNLSGGGPGPMPVQPPMPPPPPMSGVAPNSPPAYGTVMLRTGFVPDPHVIAGHAGGPVTARNVSPGCVGYVTAQPSHVIHTQTGFSQLRVVVNSGSLDTTLMVMLPNGQVACNDDGGTGANPLVAVASPPGAVRIWVGTYSANASGPYNIGFSELSHVGTENIPPPGGGVMPVGPRPPPPMQPPPPPPQPRGEMVDMQVNIPVTLIGPGLDGNTIAMWRPGDGPPTQVSLSGRSVMAGGLSIATLSPSMQDPVLTVTQLRNGSMVIRAEQAPMRRGDPGEAMLLLVTHGGRPSISERWTGRFGQRGPRWAR